MGPPAVVGEDIGIGQVGEKEQEDEEDGGGEQ